MQLYILGLGASNVIHETKHNTETMHRSVNTPAHHNTRRSLPRSRKYKPRCIKYGKMAREFRLSSVLDGFICEVVYEVFSKYYTKVTVTEGSVRNTDGSCITTSHAVHICFSSDCDSFKMISKHTRNSCDIKKEISSKLNEGVPPYACIGPQWGDTGISLEVLDVKLLAEPYWCDGSNKCLSVTLEASLTAE